MKTSSHKTIHLTENELKEALVAYLSTKGEHYLSAHLSKNAYDLDWSQNGKEFIISMDGEFDDDAVRLENVKYALNKLGVHFGGLEEALNRHVWKKPD